MAKRNIYTPSIYFSANSTFASVSQPGVTEPVLAAVSSPASAVCSCPTALVSGFGGLHQRARRVEGKAGD